MRVIYYQLEVMTELSFCGKLKDLKYLNCHLFKTKRLRKKIKSRILMFKTKNKLNKFESPNLDKRKKLFLLKQQTILKNKKMKVTSLWLQNHGREPSKNQLQSLIKAQEKLLKFNFNSNLHMDTEQRIVEIIYDMLNRMSLFITQLVQVF